MISTSLARAAAGGEEQVRSSERLLLQRDAAMSCASGDDTKGSFRDCVICFNITSLLGRLSRLRTGRGSKWAIQAPRIEIFAKEVS